MLCKSAKKIQRGGADFLMIGSTLAHKFFEDIQSAVKIPVMHCGDGLAAFLAENYSGKKVGLVGSSFLMQEKFFKEYIMRRSGV
jgi:aspartate racemase